MNVAEGRHGIGAMLSFSGFSLDRQAVGQLIKGTEMNHPENDFMEQHLLIACESPII